MEGGLEVYRLRTSAGAAFSSVCVAFVCLTAPLFLSCDSGDGGDCGPTDPDCGRPQGAVLNVPYVPQQTGVWCWAAVSEMIIAYRGGLAPQCVILSGWYRFDCCNFPGFCLTTAPLEVIQQTLVAHGVPSAVVYRPLTFDEVAAEIDAGRPLIVAYRGSFVGHVVIVYGYGIDGTLYIHDPFFGPAFQVPYGASFSYAGQLVWSETILTG